MNNQRIDELVNIYISKSENEKELKYSKIEDHIRKIKSRYYYEESSWKKNETYKINREKVYKIFFLWSYWAIDKIFKSNELYAPMYERTPIPFTWLKPLEAEIYLKNNNWDIDKAIKNISNDKGEVYFEVINTVKTFSKAILKNNYKWDYDYLTYEERKKLLTYNKSILYPYYSYLKYYNYNNFINNPEKLKLILIYFLKFVGLVILTLIILSITTDII